MAENFGSRSILYHFVPLPVFANFGEARRQRRQHGKGEWQCGQQRAHNLWYKCFAYLCKTQVS